MTDGAELEAIAQAIIDSGRYMTIGTADGQGVPWVSPVWYAPADYREFFWVSAPEARHSRNLVVRPQVSIVIFDSRAPVGTGQGVYMAALAQQVADDDLDRGIGVFSRRSQAGGAAPWTVVDVPPPARLRLFHAVASEHYVLGGQDERIAVSLER